MTARVVFIGDKLMASGFRLTGTRVITPQMQADVIWRSFLDTRAAVDLVMISEPYAGLIKARLNQYQRHSPLPPVLCLPETGEHISPARSTIDAAKTTLGLG